MAVTFAIDTSSFPFYGSFMRLPCYFLGENLSCKKVFRYIYARACRIVRWNINGVLVIFLNFESKHFSALVIDVCDVKI